MKANTLPDIVFPLSNPLTVSGLGNGIPDTRPEYRNPNRLAVCGLTSPMAAQSAELTRIPCTTPLRVVSAREERFERVRRIGNTIPTQTGSVHRPRRQTKKRQATKTDCG